MVEFVTYVQFILNTSNTVFDSFLQLYNRANTVFELHLAIGNAYECSVTLLSNTHHLFVG